MLGIIICLSGCKKDDTEKKDNTEYSAPIIFNPSITYGSMSDQDGNTYKTVTIGTQTWMAENLKTTKYNDGTTIPLLTSDTGCLNNVSSGYYWPNNSSATYKDIYGALYNWYAVNIGKLAPNGWHIPTDAEWLTLIDYCGGDSIAGDKLKEADTTHWCTPYWLEFATNGSGFTALPGGARGYEFLYIGYYGDWWTTTEDSTNGNPLYNGNIWYREMCWLHQGAMRFSTDKCVSFSVRCVKD